MPMVRPYIFNPMTNQTLGIMRPMNPLDNPIVDTLIPSDYFAPVVDLAPYGPSKQIGSVQDAVNILSVADLIFGGK